MNLVVPHLDLIVEMIEKNIFRPLPILKKSATNGEIGMEDDDVKHLIILISNLLIQHGLIYNQFMNIFYN